MFQQITRSGLNRAGARQLSTSIANKAWKTSTLSNGLKVASYENAALTATIAFAVGSGSRHEGPLNKGLNALTSALAFNNSFETAEAENIYSDFKICRMAEMHGITLSSVSGREFSYEILSGMKEQVKTMGELGGKSFALPAYEPWAVRSEAGRLQDMISEIPMEAAVIDDVHRGLYKNGLGSSVFVQTYNLQGFDETSALADYLDNIRTSKNSMLIGVGTTHEELVDIANTHLNALPSAAAPETAKPNVIGRNITVDCSSNITHACIGYDCTGVDPLVVSVIRNALGGSPRVKWGSSTFLLHNDLVSTGKPGSVNTIVQNYTDTSFLGVYIKSYADDSSALFSKINSTLDHLKANGFSKEYMNKGKNITKVDILNMNNVGMIECAMRQLASSGGQTIKDPVQLAKDVDALSNDDISNALKKILSSKRTVAVRGDMNKFDI